MRAKEAEQRFVETMRTWLVSLPFDLKILFEAVDDENLDRRTRELAVGAIIYTVSPNDAVADRHDNFTSYCDDCLVVRLALHQGMLGGGEEAERFQDRFPEFFGSLNEDLKVCEQIMGQPLFSWLMSKVETLGHITYKGKNAARYLDDGDASAELYEDGLEFTTEYPVEEEPLLDKLKKPSTVVDFIRRRRDEEARSQT